jgi:hypothetical protein
MKPEYRPDGEERANPWMARVMRSGVIGDLPGIATLAMN